MLVMLAQGCDGRAGPGAARPSADTPTASRVVTAGPGSGSAFASARIESGQADAAARTYWTPARFGGALSWLTPAARRWSAPAAPVVPAVVRVGALFSHDAGGDHFCTASVVRSPGRDMLITAAHCVHGGKGGTYRSDIVFVPGYRDRAAPYGVWLPASIIVAAAWVQSSSPALDVAFIVLRPLNGENIEDVLGADRLGINRGFRNVVRVTGYPSTGQEPLTCVNRTSRQSRYQMRFACKGYSPGTSGSPWLARFDPRTRTGLVVGVIGGYQKGGDTSDVSYSPYFGYWIGQLFTYAARYR
jgi:V8-like Glu-specific endopeptidase